MEHFMMNGYFWRVKFVDPSSRLLIDRTGNQRVATTDPKTRCVYIADDLEEDFLTTVLLHELGHCIMFSYGLLDEIHSMVDPSKWIEVEEWVCNFLADYGRQVFDIAYDVLDDKDEVWNYIPLSLESIIA